MRNQRVLGRIRIMYFHDIIYNCSDELRPLVLLGVLPFLSWTIYDIFDESAFIYLIM